MFILCLRFCNFYNFSILLKFPSLGNFICTNVMEIEIFIQNSVEMLQKCRSISLNRLTISTFIAIYYDYRVFSNLIYFHF